MEQIKPILTEYKISIDKYHNNEHIILNSTLNKILSNTTILSFTKELIEKNIITKTYKNKQYLITDEELFKILKYIKKSDKAQEFYDKLLKVTEIKKIDNNLEDINDLEETYDSENDSSSEEDDEEVKIINQNDNHGLILDNFMNEFKYEKYNILIISINGTKYYKANDIALALEYNSPKNAIYEHVTSKNKQFYENLIKNYNGSENLLLEGIHGKTIFLTKSGIYELITNSKKPEAKKFKHWLNNTVIPSIDKTGKYSMNIEDDSGYPSIYESTDLHKFINKPTFYLGYIGKHEGKKLVKFGISQNIYKRDFKEHKKKFPMFELKYLRVTDNNKNIELLFKESMDVKGIYDKTYDYGIFTSKELIILNETYTFEKIIEIANELIDKNPSQMAKESKNQIELEKIELDKLKELTKQKEIETKSKDKKEDIELEKLKELTKQKQSDNELEKLRLQIELEKIKQNKPNVQETKTEIKQEVKQEVKQEFKQEVKQSIKSIVDVKDKYAKFQMIHMKFTDKKNDIILFDDIYKIFKSWHINEYPDDSIPLCSIVKEYVEKFIFEQEIRSLREGEMRYSGWRKYKIINKNKYN